MAENRNTVQMQKVFYFLSNLKTHPNAETIYSGVKKEIPSITRATVYRNLNKLVELGKVSRLEINGEFRFDADCNLHEHCICRNCGVIFEYTNKNFPKDLLKRFKSSKFEADSVNVLFYGLCSGCGKSSKKNSMKRVRRN